jgi:hypothetical protein
VKVALRVAAALVAVVLTASGQMVASELFKPENRTTSNSGQFIIFGGTRETRSALARRGEELRTLVAKELRDQSAFTMPILLVLTPGDGMRFRQRAIFLQVFDAGDAGRKLQVDIAPGAVSDQPVLDAALVRALLLERSLRRQKFEGLRFVDPPDWLVAAILAARDRSPGSAQVYAALLQGKGMPSADRFLRQNSSALRGKAAELYAAQSLALFDGLVELPGGRQKVLENLMLVEPDTDPVQRFAQTWPDLAVDQPKLARVWALAVARFSSPSKTGFLSAEETAAQLQRLLAGLDPDASPEGPALLMLELARTEEGRFKLARAAEEAQRLGFRAHPLYASLVGEYQAMLDNLARKRRRGFERRFAETEDLRASLDGRSREITDFLNWFQTGYDGEKPIVITSRPPEDRQDRATRRNDRITRYLDSVEERGW